MLDSAWLGVNVRRANEQQVAAEALQKIADLHYDYQYELGKFVPMLVRLAEMVAELAGLRHFGNALKWILAPHQ